MSGAQDYQDAREYLEEAAAAAPGSEERRYFLAMADVRAKLAHAAATALQFLHEHYDMSREAGAWGDVLALPCSPEPDPPDVPGSESRSDTHAAIGDVIKCQECGRQSRSISKGCSICGYGAPAATAPAVDATRLPFDHFAPVTAAAQSEPEVCSDVEGRHVNGELPPDEPTLQIHAITPTHPAGRAE